MMRSEKRGGVSRRNLLAGLAGAPVLAAAMPGPPAAAQTAGAGAAAEKVRAELKTAKGTKLVLLGTGAGPVPTIPGRSRRMTSNVMLSNGAAYVLDCGLGLTNEFARTGLSFHAVRGVFITHHHPDHNIEYGPFLVIGWIQGMPLSVRAYGPPPLKEMTEDYLRSMKTTIGFWSEDFKMTPLTTIEVQEVAAAGPVMQDDNVKVSAIIVNHPPVKPALGYRFDFRDRSIAFSGDTTPLEAVAVMAKGADLLVHEAMNLPATEAYVRHVIAQGRPVKLDVFMKHMRADHTPLADVGRIAEEAGVKTLVLNHLTPAEDSLTDDSWRAPAAKHFKGEIIVAHDLMVV